jgi:hypothetical protein
LEDSPLPLWELRWHEETTLQALAAILAPGLISPAARGLVEVRRFRTWPAQWDEGQPLSEDDLTRESSRVEVWSVGTGTPYWPPTSRRLVTGFCSLLLRPYGDFDRANKVNGQDRSLRSALNKRVRHLGFLWWLLGTRSMEWDGYCRNRATVPAQMVISTNHVAPA